MHVQINSREVAVVQWNHLPSQAVVCTDLDSFSSAICAPTLNAIDLDILFLPAFNLSFTNSYFTFKF